MNLQGRAYYNSVRMDWVDDPTLELDPWQVEDYRSLAQDTLFEKLEDLGFSLDKDAFVELATDLDTPEDMTKALVGDSVDVIESQVYLVVFELWRRLLPDKLSLSVFCDEMDTLIYQFNRDEGVNAEDVEDMLAHLQLFLDENCDEGIDPTEAFSTVQSYCANDIEAFLYDYIADQIDGGNTVYASELIEGFRRYLPESKWFAILEARLVAGSEDEEAGVAIKKLIKLFNKDFDLAFCFEVLALLVSHGDEESFKSVVRKTIPVLVNEEDFKFLLSECADFYHRLDQEKVEAAIAVIAQRRKGIPLDQHLQSNDPDFSVLLKQLS